MRKTLQRKSFHTCDKSVEINLKVNTCICYEEQVLAQTSLACSKSPKVFDFRQNLAIFLLFLFSTIRRFLQLPVFPPDYSGLLSARIHVMILHRMIYMYQSRHPLPVTQLQTSCSVCKVYSASVYLFVQARNKVSLQDRCHL